MATKKVSSSLAFSLSAPMAALALALYFSLSANLPLLQTFWNAPDAGHGLARVFFTLGGWAIGVALVWLLFLLFSVLLYGRAFKALLMLAVIIAAPIGYFAFFYGMRFDRAMLMSVLQTHTGEAMDLIGWRLVLWCLIFAGPALWLLWRSRIVEHRPWWKNLGLKSLAGLASLVLIVAAAFPQYQRLASAVRNKAVVFYDVTPANVLAAAVSHIIKRADSPSVIEKVGLDAHQKYALPKPRLVVFVLGETARAQNFSWNGYARETSPHMRAEGAILFKDVESCGTVTATSVPCIFSGLGRKAYSPGKAQARESLIDVLARAGVRVIWHDNDAGCKGICGAAEYVDYNEANDPRHCRPGERGECLDAILLEGLEDKLRQQPRDTLVVLHIKGSHGPAYFKRYPPEFERFTPACRSKELSACTREELLNAYDNTLLYTDHILDEVVDLLKSLSDRFATAMVYVSDHGESLGEKGLYLHGAPFAIAPDEQTRVPMLAWLSPQFLALEGWDARCVQAQAERTGLSHDYLYSTLLGLLDVATSVYRKPLDIFADCDRDGIALKSAP